MSVTANLVVPLEFPTWGYASDTTTNWASGYHDFNRSVLPFNSSDYDGSCTYYFEVVASNVNASNSYNVYLYDSTNATVEATIAVAANTTVANSTRLRSTAFTPASGDVNYKVRLDATGTAGDLDVYAARIIIVQEGATKTRVQIPLIGAPNASTTAQDSIYDGPDQSQQTSYGQYTTYHYGSWHRDDSDWGTGTTFELEVVMARSSGTASACLYNVTESQVVTASEVTTSSSGYNVCNSGALSGTYWQDGDTYDFRCKISSASYYCCIISACIYATVTDLSAAEVYWWIHHASQGNTAVNNVYQRVKLDTGSYSSPVCYFEATGYEATSGEAVLKLYDDSTDDYGTAGAATVTNSTLTPATTKGWMRSSALSGLTSGNRIFARRDASTYLLYVSQAFLVVAVTGETEGWVGLTVIRDVSS